MLATTSPACSGSSTRYPPVMRTLPGAETLAVAVVVMVVMVVMVKCQSTTSLKRL